MEVSPNEKTNHGPHDANFPYTYHRISTYDPNMCSAARFSPPYPNQQNDTDANYENVILIPCTDTQQMENATNPIQCRTEAPSSYLIPNSSEYETPATEHVNDPPVFGSHRVNQITSTCTTTTSLRAISVEQIDNGRNNYIHQTSTADSTGSSVESQNAHIILHRSPNGHIYQNYYVNQDFQGSEMVELVQIGENGQMYEQDYVHVKNSHVLPPVEYNYDPKLPNNGELMAHLSDTTFVHLESTIIPEQSQEFLGESYEHVNNDPSAQLSVHQGKDQQRILLESTMSPLLAAVNDITQRDAELQSYLNQISIKGNANNVSFSSDDTNKRCEEGNQISGNMNDCVETNFVNNNKIKSKTVKFVENRNEEDDYLLVSDKPVESRARASLPTNYLYFGKTKNDNEAPSVFARKEISLRTKFGPFEGEAQLTTEEMVDVLRIQTVRTYPILLLEETRILDTSSESTSNWMRFVQMAHNFSEQNLLLLEEAGKLYFKCCRIIKPKEELRVGYSDQYAELYGLRTLTPTEEESQDIFVRENPWVCYECDQRFPTSNEMQNHLNVHDDVDGDAEREQKRKTKNRKKKKTLKRFVEVRKNSSRCCYCLKVFMTSVSLKKHIAHHLVEKRSCKAFSKNSSNEANHYFRCSICYKKFNSEEKLKNHRLNHVKNELRSFSCCHCDQSFSTSTALAVHMKHHTNRHFKCVFCPETFKRVAEFKNHVVIHAVDGIYTCNLCKKKYREYYLVRKHIRIFHPAVKYSCNECGRQFINMNFLRRHKVCHSDKRDFLCSECGKQFKRKDKLREHILRIHNENRKTSRKKKVLEEKLNNDVSRYLELSPVKDKLPKQPKDPPSDFQDFVYKCNECVIGFKRRGMLVNHIAKRHPEVHIDSIPELNLPIIKPQSLFFCQYCTKVYKSNGKRKIHILKNHPGQALPPSVRSQPELSQINVKMVGNVKTEPQRCQWCYKQYATRNRLLSHYRKEHAGGKQATDVSKQQFVPRAPDEFYRPPNSPENKLLKLSSAALELSSLEDRKFFDFLNERSDDHSSITQAGPLDDNANAFSKVDVNFKVVDGEFTETSSSAELNRLPQLFEESIACI